MIFKNQSIIILCKSTDIIEEIRYMISFYESNQNNHILLRYEDI